MLEDRYGNRLSTRSRAAVEKFNEAALAARIFQGDPIAALEAAIAEDPDFAMAHAVRAGLFAQLTDKAYLGEAEASIAAGEACAKTEHERDYLAAAAAWARGRFDEGTAKFARIAQEHPRDVLALQSAHMGCFFLGRASDLRDWPLQALRAFSPGDDGYHALLGMAAFGLEECGDYARADALGREAVALEPRDGWAVHAVAHVNEMRGDTDTGIPWLRDSGDIWSADSGFAYHNWWHLALLHIDRLEHGEALKLFDEKIRPHPKSQMILEWVDASALLWRLHLEGVDVGARWAGVAELWRRASGDAIYAFNDLHAIMAFLGAGDIAAAERTLAAMRKAAQGDGDNAYLTREVGLPLAEGFIAYEAGRYEEAVEKILAKRGVAQRFGGSHAQRDILTLTALHAALKGGMRETAAAFAAERVALKPESPWARMLAKRAADLPSQTRN